MEVAASEERSILASLETLGDYQAITSGELNTMAAGHARQSKGLLSVLPNNHDVYVPQRFTHVFVDGSPASLDELKNLGNTVNPHFPYILERLHEEESRSQELSRIGEDLASGQNIIIITNHGKIQDIAETLGAYYIGIQEAGEATQRSYDFMTNLVLSKMTTHLEILGIPVSEVLKQVCDRQYLTFPRTESIKKSAIPELPIRAYNSVFRQLFKFRMSRGSNLIGIAPSGTTDKQLDPDKPDEFTLAPVGKKTVEILMSSNTKVLPVAVWNDGNNQVFEPLGAPRPMQKPDDVHEAMASIAAVLTKEVANNEFVYRRPSLLQKG